MTAAGIRILKSARQAQAIALTPRQSIAEQLEARIAARDVHLQIALSKFHNAGGSYQRALALLDAAYSGGGAGKIYYPDAADDAATAKGSGGHHAHAEPAEDNPPAASRPNDDTGHRSGADKAIVEPPVAATTPGHARRGIAAIGAVQGAVARSLFDSTVLPDGRRLREVRWAECPALAKRYRTLSRVLTAVHGHATPPDPNDTLDTIVNESRLAEIIHAAELANDVT